MPASDAITIAVFDPGARASSALMASLRDYNVISMKPRLGVEAISEAVVDVALLGFTGDSFRAFEIAVWLRNRQPWIEALFWFDESAHMSAVAAVRALGMDRAASISDLLTWIDPGLRRMAAVARARRALIFAERELPPLTTDFAPAAAQPLPEAERAFREAYIRRLLSEAPHYSEAARKAGVPYTTLCSMIKKLNL